MIYPFTKQFGSRTEAQGLTFQFLAESTTIITEDRALTYYKCICHLHICKFERMTAHEELDIF